MVFERPYKKDNLIDNVCLGLGYISGTMLYIYHIRARYNKWWLPQIALLCLVNLKVQTVATRLMNTEEFGNFSETLISQ